jgi:RimJ/RimL family protein N-acetyltransferase
VSAVMGGRRQGIRTRGGFRSDRVLTSHEGAIVPENVNHLGQPVGPPVPNWKPRLPPPRTPMVGKYCRVEPFDIEKHARDLFEAYAADHENTLWTYLPHGPYPRLEGYLERMRTVCSGDDPLVHAIIAMRRGKPLGQASYMSIDPHAGCIEVGAIIYAPALQRTTPATEAMYLMMRRVFDELGYRRYAWQCNALNGPSRAAAARLGFSLEGIFRQASVSKECNRDTAWFSILDHEWPAQKDAFEQWLDPGNLGTSGRQRRSLSSLVLRAPHRA